MKSAFQIARYVLYDLLRSKLIPVYTLLLFAVSSVFFYMDGDATKSLISLLNIVLLLIPLVTIVFCTIHFYNSREFMEMLLSQPVSRKNLYAAQWMSVTGSLCIAFLTGVGGAILFWSPNALFLLLLISGLFLTLVFSSIAFLISSSINDKAKGMGVTLLVWFFFAIIYDGIVLSMLFAFSDYPLDGLVVVLSALNPIDLARLLLLLKIDNAAILGYTGNIFKNFLGTNVGIAAASFTLLLWVIIPWQWGWRIFNRKDF